MVTQQLGEDLGVDSVLDFKKNFSTSRSGEATYIWAGTTRSITFDLSNPVSISPIKKVCVTNASASVTYCIRSGYGGALNFSYFASISCIISEDQKHVTVNIYVYPYPGDEAGGLAMDVKFTMYASGWIL